MSRVKLTTNNHCHKPVKGGEPVEKLIDVAVLGQLSEYLAAGNSVNVVANQGISALHALARNKSGTQRDRTALEALLEAGIDVNMVNNRNETALFRAVLTSSHWMVDSLLSHGASLDVINNKGLSLEDIAEGNPKLMSIIERAKLDRGSPAAAHYRPRRSI